jgi:uncharacterized protein
MSHEFVASRLDVQAFAKAGGVLSGQSSLSEYGRLLDETGRQGAERVVHWQVQGAMRLDASGFSQVWLHLDARVNLPLTCQRCLEAADIDVVVDRDFRFVPTEEQAEAEDEEAEEDVLALSRDLDLQVLIEDELLMALPLVPLHDTCPTPVKLSAQDADFDAAEAAKPNPFAVLAGFKGGSPGG